jgi:hypothetical protein
MSANPRSQSAADSGPGRRNRRGGRALGVGADVGVRIRAGRPERVPGRRVGGQRQQCDHGRLPDVGVRVGQRAGQRRDRHVRVGRGQCPRRSGPDLPGRVLFRRGERPDREQVQRVRAAHRPGGLERRRPHQRIGVPGQPLQRGPDVHLPGGVVLTPRPSD